MNRLLTVLLILTLTVPFAFRFSVVMNYAVQFDYYKDVLCENKAKPELKCNGTCQLVKELKTDTDNGSSEIPEAFRMEIGPVLCSNQLVFMYINRELNDIRTKLERDFHILSGFSMTLDKPPTNCS
jgi:hypothetical protein